MPETIRPPTQKRRADLMLVERGVFESRAKAQAAIAAGLVTADGALVRRASDGLSPDAAIEASAPHPWVSRGGVKLAFALDHFGFDVAGTHALDVGASTGGFTDVLLARGAARVTAVDVGRGQLHPKIAGDKRVRSLEGTDIRNLAAGDFETPPTIVVIDVSFAPLKAALPAALALAAPDAAVVALIKPQFEVGRRDVGKGGIVKDETARERAVADARALAEELGVEVADVIPSPIAGGDGNIEFLLGGRRRGA